MYFFLCCTVKTLNSTEHMSSDCDNCCYDQSKGDCKGPGNHYRIIAQTGNNGTDSHGYNTTYGYYQLLAYNGLTCTDDNDSNITYPGKGCTGCDKAGSPCNNQKGTCQFDSNGTEWGVYYCPKNGTGGTEGWTTETLSNNTTINIENTDCATASNNYALFADYVVMCNDADGGTDHCAHAYYDTDAENNNIPAYNNCGPQSS